MTKLQDVLSPELTAPLEEALFKQAGFHGSTTGSIVQHSDGDLTVDFSEVQDADGEEIEDEEQAYAIGLVLSEQCFDHMMRISYLHDELIDIELEITF